MSRPSACGDQTTDQTQGAFNLGQPNRCQSILSVLGVWKQALQVSDEGYHGTMLTIGEAWIAASIEAFQDLPW